MSYLFLTGPLSTAQDSKKHISSKVVAIILLLCVILTTFAFLASALCYFYRRDKCPIQTPMFSSDIETSCNSATNLISRGTSSVLATKVTADFPINPSTGKSSFNFVLRYLSQRFVFTFLCVYFYQRLY